MQQVSSCAASSTRSNILCYVQTFSPFIVSFQSASSVITFWKSLILPAIQQPTAQVFFQKQLPPMLRQRTTVSNIPDVEMLSACVPDSSLFLHRTRGLYLRNRLAAEETGNVFVAPQIHKSILTFGSQGKRAITTYRGNPHIPAKRCPVRCPGSGLDCCAV
jgi:hypothetical protein